MHTCIIAQNSVLQEQSCFIGQTGRQTKPIVFLGASSPLCWFNNKESLSCDHRSFCNFIYRCHKGVYKPKLTPFRLTAKILLCLSHPVVLHLSPMLFTFSPKHIWWGAQIMKPPSPRNFQIFSSALASLSCWVLIGSGVITSVALRAHS